MISTTRAAGEILIARLDKHGAKQDPSRHSAGLSALKPGRGLSPSNQLQLTPAAAAITHTITPAHSWQEKHTRITRINRRRLTRLGSQAQMESA